MIWSGRREPGAAYERWWRWSASAVLCIGSIVGLFAALLWVTDLVGPAAQVGAIAGVFGMMGVGLLLAPAYLRDPCKYVITDRRVIFRRGGRTRSIERVTLTYARIHWHHRVSRVGTLELVRATPFGPLMRRQRIRLFDITEPDRVLCFLRGERPSDHMGDGVLPLVERLDEEETVTWGGHPEGLSLGWRELLTGLAGLGLMATAFVYGIRAMGVLVDLENRGLFPRSWEWVFMFLAILLTFIFMMAVGGLLLWFGLWRARTLGAATEYLLTSRRLLVRRGRVELSVDRNRIVDVVVRRVTGRLHHLFLVLDTPGSRALSDSGALERWVPSREALLPVLYEVRDPETVRRLLLDSTSR